jgi:Tetracyclin repressor-like, C-terminal domain
MVYQLMFLRTLPEYGPSVAALEVAGRAFYSLVAAVQRAMVAGVIVEGPLTETAQLIWSSIHGWVALELLGIGMIEDDDSGFDRVCKTMLRGLRPQSEASE